MDRKTEMHSRFKISLNSIFNNILELGKLRAAQIPRKGVFKSPK